MADTWTPDSSVVSGLGDIGNLSSPAVFDDLGTWKLIAGEYNGNFNGWYWNGSDWISDSFIVSGLDDVGTYSAPTVFVDSGTWKSIAGDYNGNFHGYLGPTISSGTISIGKQNSQGASILGGIPSGKQNSPGISISGGMSLGL